MYYKTLHAVLRNLVTWNKLQQRGTKSEQDMPQSSISEIYSQINSQTKFERRKTFALNQQKSNKKVFAHIALLHTLGKKYTASI